MAIVRIISDALEGGGWTLMVAAVSLAYALHERVQRGVARALIALHPLPLFIRFGPDSVRVPLSWQNTWLVVALGVTCVLYANWWFRGPFWVRAIGFLPAAIPAGLWWLRTSMLGTFEAAGPTEIWWGKMFDGAIVLVGCAIAYAATDNGNPGLRRLLVVTHPLAFLVVMVMAMTMEPITDWFAFRRAEPLLLGLTGLACALALLSGFVFRGPHPARAIAILVVVCGLRLADESVLLLVPKEASRPVSVR